MHADPDLARAEAAEQARERGVFVGRSDEHGTKTMYIKAAAGAVIRNKATLDAIAEALKTFGDTRPVQHRRADAVGIIADPRYTQELLTQARHHHLHTTTPDTTAPDTTAHDTTAPATTGAPDTTAPGTTEPGATSRAPPSRTPPPRAPPLRARPLRAPPSRRDRRPMPHRTADQPGPLGHAPLGAAPLRGSTAPDSADPGRGRSRRPGGPRRQTCSTTGPSVRDEPGPDDEADRDAPHPSTSDLPDPLDTPDTVPIEPFDPSDPGLHLDPDDGEPLNAAARRALHARLAQIKHDAYTTHATRTGADRAGSPDRARGRVRPGQTEIYVHLTDHTLATGTGVLRAEGIGPLLADQLAELIGHGPYTVKPVIDLNDAVSVDAYEIPDRIRERVKLTHPVELFPFGTQETHRGMDLDHLQPYDPLGPPGQTSTTEPRTARPLRPPGQDPRPRLDRPPPRPQDPGMDHTPRLHLPRDPTGTIRVNRPRSEYPT